MLRGINSLNGRDYFGKVWEKTVIAVSPNYTSQDCSNCGYRVKKSLSTRWRSLPEGLTHKCSQCGVEICRDTNAALNILKRGLEVLGVEYNSTLGHRETAEYSGTLEKTSASINKGQPDLISGVAESRIIS